jgi:hypothetical protein
MKGSAALRRIDGHSVVMRFECPPCGLRLGLQAADPLVLHRAHGLLVDRWTCNLIDNALEHGRTPVAVSLAREGQVLTLDVCDLGDRWPEGSSGVRLEAFARGDARRGWRTSTWPRMTCARAGRRTCWHHRRCESPKHRSTPRSRR